MRLEAIVRRKHRDGGHEETVAAPWRIHVGPRFHHLQRRAMDAGTTNASVRT